MKVTWKPECKHFLGHKPCPKKISCQGCGYYQQWSRNILLIKLGAKGDVLRTTPLATALKQKDPRCRLTWLTLSDSLPLLEGNPDIDRMLGYGSESLTQILTEKYDEVICLDKEPYAAGLASLIPARFKHGFGWHRNGYLIPLNKSSQHLYDLGLSDELKFKRNKKSYQQLIIEACDLKYRNQNYVLNLTKAERDWAKDYLKSFRGLSQKKYLIGINTGTGTAFPTKAWPAENIIRLHSLLKQDKEIGTILLGGKAESELNKEILRKCPGMQMAGNDLNLRQFASVIGMVDILTSADTLAMHIGIALKRKVIALFGPTCAQEIELYGRGIKIESKTECSPCYRSSCDNAICMEGITAESVASVVKKLLYP